MKHIVINGVSSKSLGIRFINMSKDNVIFAESKTKLTDGDELLEVDTRDDRRQIVTSSYEIGVYNADVYVIDAIKRWIHKENVPFQPNENIEREYIAYKFQLTGVSQAVNHVYILTLTITHSGIAYSKKRKEAGKSNNFLTFENLGTHATYPCFEFTVESPLKMIGFTHPNGKAFQLGVATGEVILKTGEKIKIDIEKMAIYRHNQRIFHVFNLSSQSFMIDVGITKIAVTVDSDGRIPNDLRGYIKEAYL